LKVEEKSDKSPFPVGAKNLKKHEKKDVFSKTGPLNEAKSDLNKLKLQNSLMFDEKIAKLNNDKGKKIVVFKSQPMRKHPGSPDIETMLKKNPKLEKMLGSDLVKKLKSAHAHAQNFKINKKYYGNHKTLKKPYKVIFNKKKGDKSEVPSSELKPVLAKPLKKSLLEKKDPKSETFSTDHKAALKKPTISKSVTKDDSKDSQVSKPIIKKTGVITKTDKKDASPTKLKETPKFKSDDIYGLEKTHQKYKGKSIKKHRKKYHRNHRHGHGLRRYHKRKSASHKKKPAEKLTVGEKPRLRKDTSGMSNSNLQKIPIIQLPQSLKDNTPIRFGQPRPIDPKKSIMTKKELLRKVLIN
jgi:hypothetical protein